MKKKSAIASIKAFVERVKEIRAYKNLTLEEVSEVCDLKVPYLSKIEQGKTDVQISSADKIKKGLGVTDIEFADRENYPPKKNSSNENDKK